MRFPFLTALVAGAVLGQVSATPLRVVIVSSSSTSELDSGTANKNIRLGHAVPHIDNGHVAALATPAGSGGKIRRPCNGRLRHKALDVFRKVFGLPSAEVSKISTKDAAPNTKGKYRILPFVGTPPALIEVSQGKQEDNHEGNHEGNHPKEGKGAKQPHHHHHHHHHHKHHRGGKKAAFMERLHFALTALGPWEGRAVAFVLGCGIGVLLRMLWVLTVVSYRVFRGNKEDENKYTEVLVVQEYLDSEPAVAAPPTYTYADEKSDTKVVAHDAPEQTK